MRQPFNVNLLGQLAATEALKHPDQVAERRETNARLRDLLVERLAERGRATVPSQANFMLVDIDGLRVPQDEVCGALLSMGAIVRDGNALGCPGWARVTVGTEEEIEFLLDKLARARGRPRGARRGEPAVSMMVIMHEAATDEEVAHVCARVEEIGASAHISAGERVKVIGVIGDREAITQLPLEAMPGVDRVVAILRPYKLVSREFQQRDTVIDVKGARIGGGHFALIAGPCSIETPEQVLAAAKAVKAAGGHMMRGGAFKPRTSPYAFQGLGEDGLAMMAAASAETGLPIVTEVMDPRDLDVVCRYADVLQVGARNTQNFLLLAELGKAGKPVLLKRGPSTTIEELLMAAEYIVKEGNRDVILCERGIRTFETATRNTLDVSAVPVIKIASHLPVVVDPSHSAGRLDLVLPLSLAGVAAGADGVLVETHPNPEHALCDGPQSLPTAVFGEYAERVLDLARWTGKTV